MIVDLNLAGKRAVVIGGGTEAQKRIRALLGEGCEVTVIAGSAAPGIRRMAAAKRISLEERRVRGAGFIAGYRPDLVIAATDDAKLNESIARAAKRRRVLAYRSDSPAESDFANMSVIGIGGVVRVAISTGGRSPAMSRRIREKSERALRGAITREDIARIRVQEHARRIARGAIPSQAARRRYLGAVMADPGIDQLIKDGQLRRARGRATAMLGDWGWAGA